MATTELQKQALEILNWSQRKLAAKLPEFSPAIYLLSLKETELPSHLHSDGKLLYYHSETVVRDYLERKDSVAMQLLHIITHGLMGHFSKRTGWHEQVFDAAADMKAEAFIRRLPTGFTERHSSGEAKTLEEYDKLSLELACQLPANRQEATELVQRLAPFHRDLHTLWNPKKDKQDGNVTGNAERDKAGGVGDELKKLWDQIAQQVASAMNSAPNHHYGNLAGGIREEFRDVPESSVSYAELIRRFCRTQEQQTVDPDSINPMWYHMGLSLTGNAPIIEQEELREDIPVMEMAVALDTSGSCCGEIMQGFLSELLAILRDAGGPHLEFTLIQCDAEIQSVQTMTQEDTVEQLMQGMKIQGFGGTDFRPVFKYIDRHNKNAENKPIRGLLYLSDGCGAFPAKNPDYPTVFLFPRDQSEDFFTPEVPKWVTRAYIQPDQRLLIKEGNE